MDASMASAESLTSMRDDSDGFLFYDDDDISASSDMTDSDSEGDEDEEDSEEDSDDSSSSSSDGSLDHGAMDDAEELLQNISNLRQGMQRVRSANSLRSMLSKASIGSLNPGTPREKVRRRMLEKSQRNAQAPRRAGTRGPAGQQLEGSNSIGNMALLKQHMDAEAKAARQSTLRESSSAGTHIGQMKSAQAIDVDDGAQKPDDRLKELLGGGETFRYDALEGFFLETKPEYVAAWTNDITKAVRDHNLKALEEMHLRGERLQACNQFGESIVHLCVRRGTPEILRFLLQDAGVSMRVCCENGRTPVHDAAWCLNDNPKSYQMLMILMAESPMQLHITDKRGFTPLSYVPRARWAECNRFLDKQYAKGRLSSLDTSSKRNQCFNSSDRSLSQA